MNAKVTSPLLRYHGAKFRLAPWVMSFFPDHHTYVEPFGGAAGVLLQKARSMSEVYNDLDGEIVNVFRVLQDRTQAEQLETLLRITPYARAEFELSYQHCDDPVERARRTIIRAFQGFGSGGATKGATGFRIDSAREYGTAAHLWVRYPDEIASFVERLQNVVIENKPAVDLIPNHDRRETLFYVDPPYVFSTRESRGRKTYRHELSDTDHESLLHLLSNTTGMVILSGYDTDIYNDHLTGWEKFHTTARISSGRGTATRQETIWMNPACSARQSQQRLFD